ncbi:hypothetical protein J6590_025681 [Homalodisca vitripennis]|nr:hypothetical protein J6590_025681 [Homalodisca vitripennis]
MGATPAHFGPETETKEHFYSESHPFRCNPHDFCHRTVDETWIYHYTPEIKQSKQWIRGSSRSQDWSHWQPQLNTNSDYFTSVISVELTNLSLLMTCRTRTSPTVSHFTMVIRANIDKLTQVHCVGNISSANKDSYYLVILTPTTSVIIVELTNLSLVVTCSTRTSPTVSHFAMVIRANIDKLTQVHCVGNISSANRDSYYLVILTPTTSVIIVELTNLSLVVTCSTRTSPTVSHFAMVIRANIDKLTQVACVRNISSANKDSYYLVILTPTTSVIIVELTNLSLLMTCSTRTSPTVSHFAMVIRANIDKLTQVAFVRNISSANKDSYYLVMLTCQRLTKSYMSCLSSL